jgi:hypothetical protein
MASIERNVFDFNRHAIAAGGQEGVGYNAFLNLVLKGGGHHDTLLNTWTHQFDVHGDDDCYDVIPWYEERWYNCGNAGTTFQFVGNTIQFDNDRAIKIRGTPRDSAIIRNNVLAHGSLGDAIAPTDNGRVSVQSNITGSDQYGNYGVCDFDGDSRDDLFMATGVSWWYASAGRREWTFLNAQPERLSSVGLGDFDGDGRCDVFAVHDHHWSLSRGGSGPFVSLGIFAVPFDQLAFGDFNGDRIQDVFRRTPDHQWLAVSPGIYPWTPLAGSGFPLSALRFGDFDGNGVTDVAAVQAGHWSVSWDARTAWQPLNTQMSSSLEQVLIGNVDGIAGDDIVRFVRENALSARWEVSSGGAGPWTALTRLDYPGNIHPLTQKPHDFVADLRTFIGRFDGLPGADLVVLEYSRGSFINTDGTLYTYGLYAH